MQKVKCVLWCARSQTGPDNEAPWELEGDVDDRVGPPEGVQGFGVLSCYQISRVKFRASGCCGGLGGLVDSNHSN